MSPSYLLSLPLCLLLAACASQPPAAATQTTAQAPTCYDKAPMTGSSIVRRTQCAETSDEQRDAAREQADRLRDERNRSNPPKMPGKSKP